MIRTAEMVLPGHPDKFCDQIADNIVYECKRIDQYAYCQVEVSVWSDQVWLSGGITTQSPLKKRIEDIVIQTGMMVGYRDGNWLDAHKYQVTSTICQIVDNPSIWTGKVNDQCISVGYAGYDPKTHYLPPEQFLVHEFRHAIEKSFINGLLKNEGPDGKFLIRMREERDLWVLEQILITLQQRPSTEFLELTKKVEKVLKRAYSNISQLDHRWTAKWEEIEMLINPNGPLINGGSDGDNGQTGRKLVVDYYGPRIPIGGGALSGKDLTHIDRAAAYCAREAAVRSVQTGARECTVQLTYAPNLSAPLDINYIMEGCGGRQKSEFFQHENICARYLNVFVNANTARGDHFYSKHYPWNGML